MSDGRRGGADEARPRLSIQDRIGLVQRQVMRNRQIQAGMEIVNDFGKVGGGLLSAGLAFNALFAIIPAILVVVGALGIFIDDPVKRQQTVDYLVTAIPPLEPVARTIVDTLANSSRVTTVIGLIGVVWGASGFYGALAGAFTLLFPGAKTRGPVEQRVRGVIGVLVIIGMVFAVVGFQAVMSIATALFTIPGIDTWHLVTIVLTIVGSIVVTFALYLIVPANAPSGRAATLPALIFGGAIGLLTALFSLVGPLLVRGFVALGVIASVFIALVWLNLVFQALLYGAAWAAIRRNHERRIGAVPAI
jgi:membrane protein